MPSTGPRHRRRSATCTAGGGASSPALGAVDVSVARSPDELGPALEEAFALHARRWEGRPDGSGFASTDRPAVPPRDAGATGRDRRGSDRDAARGRSRGGVPLLLRAGGVHVRAPPSLRSRLGPVLARAREHARCDRGRRRGRSPEGRVPRRRRALQGRAGGSLRAAVRRRRRDVECSRASLCGSAHERHPPPAAPQALPAAAPAVLRRRRTRAPPGAPLARAGHEEPDARTRHRRRRVHRLPPRRRAARPRRRSLDGRPPSPQPEAVVRRGAAARRAALRRGPARPPCAATGVRRRPARGRPAPGRAGRRPSRRSPIRPSTPRSTWPGPCRCWRPRARSEPAGW